MAHFAIRRTLFVTALLLGLSTWATQPPIWETQPPIWESIETQLPWWV
jgi:hypothetical protein